MDVYLRCLHIYTYLDNYYGEAPPIEGPAGVIWNSQNTIQWNLLSILYVPQKGHKISTYYQKYLLSGLVYIREVYTGTERGVLTVQEYVLNQILTIRVGLCTWGIHRDRTRSTYHPGVCTKPGTYYQGWFMYMRYTQGHQEYVLNQVLTIRVGLCTWGIHRDRTRSTYHPGVCAKPGTYYQGWFVYMRYTQGQNEEYLPSRSMC